MTLYLKIDQDENSEFFSIFDHLSPLRKKIWNKIAQKCRSWKNVMPSQSKIAEWCGCSRSAVSEAFRIFQQHGWINLQSRGWKRSKSIFMPHSKQMIDTVNRKYFKRTEATYRATHTYSIYKNITSRASEIPKKSLDPSLLGKKLGFSNDGCLKLSLVSEHVQQEALKCAKELGKQGWLPHNQERYFIGMAFKMAEKCGEVIEWRKYYQSSRYG